MHCKLCGTQMIVREWEDRPRPVCPDCQYVHYEQLKVGAGVLVQRQGKLLLVQRPADSEVFPSAWGIPAGYCEADEDPAEAARRAFS